MGKDFPNKYTTFCSNCNFATRYGKRNSHNIVENHNDNILIFETKVSQEK